VCTPLHGEGIAALPRANDALNGIHQTMPGWIWWGRGGSVESPKLKTNETLHHMRNSILGIFQGEECHQTPNRDQLQQSISQTPFTKFLYQPQK